MKKLICLILSVTIVTVTFGQDDPYSEPVMSAKEQRQLAKEKKMAEKEAEQAQIQQLLFEIINSRRFVLEADYVSGNTGVRQPVSSSINFILVDSLEATLQLGSPWGLGYNGVGGITIDGDVNKFEVTERQTKRGTSYNITMYISSAMGIYDIQFWISTSGSAEATVRGNYSGSVTYSGRIKPLKQSKIYKGSSVG
jgi:hypothetical protein